MLLTQPFLIVWKLKRVEGKFPVWKTPSDVFFNYKTIYALYIIC